MFCTKCGNQLMDEAAVCPKCGCAVEGAKPQQQNNNVALRTIAKAFMIISTVVWGCATFGLALAWCLPMTIIYWKKVNRGEQVSTAFKICTLLFVNTMSRIMMLIDNSQNSNAPLRTLTKVYMIISTVVCGCLTFGLSLAWMLPMTIIYFKKVNRGEPVSTAFKVCTLLFVGIQSGIMMLVDNGQ